MKSPYPDQHKLQILWDEERWDKELTELFKSGLPHERKLPKVLTDRLRCALLSIKKLGLSSKDAREFRARDLSNKGNRNAIIAVYGLDPIPTFNLKPFPSGYHDAVKELEGACNEVGRFINGGAEDYCAAPVVALAEQHLKSKNARIRASAPRKKEDKTVAFLLWKEWQTKPTNYPNKQTYISDVMSKCEVSPKTARNWFDDFRADSSPEWEAKFGNKYTKL